MATAAISERQKLVLGVIVREHVATAMPVGSQAIAHKYPLGVSPATVRNDMAELEEAGYITHPHTSAGRVPSKQGYRYFVDWLLQERDLPLAEQRMIRHQFHQVETELGEWMRLAAVVLAQSVQNLAVVTFPKASQSRLERIELLHVHDTLALLVLMLQRAVLRQQMLSLFRPQSPEQLAALAVRL